jgi:hypothetical protein
MRIVRRALCALAGLLAFTALTGGIAAAADRPYTEGAVLNVSAVRTEPGMFEEYMKYLAGPYQQSMEEQKKAGDHRLHAFMPIRVVPTIPISTS